MRDIYLLLHDQSELQDDLNKSTWRADRNLSLHSDVDWRADHLAMEPSFWNLVDADSKPFFRLIPYPSPPTPLLPKSGNADSEMCSALATFGGTCNGRYGTTRWTSAHRPSCR